MSQEKQTKAVRAENRRIILRIVQSAKPIRWWLALGCILALVVVSCALAGPKLLGGIVQVLYDHWSLRLSGGTPDEPLWWSLRPGLMLLLGVYGLQSLFSYLKMQLLNRVVSMHFTCNLRIQIADKIRRLPVKFVDDTPVGEVLQRMTNDVSRMGNTVHEIIDTMMSGFLQIIAIAAVMLLEDWRLALMVIVIMPLSIKLSAYVSEKSSTYFREMHKQSGRLYAVVEESYTNYATTKAYNLEHYNRARHQEVSDLQRRAEARANFLASVVQPVIAFTNAAAYILINLLGGWLVVYRGVSVGTVMTIVLFARQIASPLEQIANGMSNIQHASAAAGRVFALLDREEEDPVQGEMDVSAVRGQVVFENVSFSYDKSRPLIQDLNIRVEPGQKVAIVGPTGAGKTTIVNLLMRFYDVDRGRILVDGTDLSAVSRDSSRALFAMVLQDTWLFKGTVAENVAYGKPEATREEIVRACDEAYCDHFIRTLPKGYDTVIGEDNITISGGQKQLLTIARALLADRELLILDEATSNVDTRTEILIQKAMDKLMRRRTCFVIAHRLSTIVDADVILVLNDGRIVEQGTHRELLERRGFYHQLYTSQYAV